MKAATVHEIKDELQGLPASKLTAICLRLAKFKKENKELLTYLLFEAGDNEGYIQSVKLEMDDLFEEINFSNVFFIKKTLRKILRITNKHVRYIGDKTAEVELILYFCEQVKANKIPLNKSVLLSNIFNSQQKKLEKLIAALHEDLQYDFLQRLKKIH